MQVTDAMVAKALAEWSKINETRHPEVIMRAALTAALAHMWRPVSDEVDDKAILFFPSNVIGSHNQMTMPPMFRIDRPSAYPHRRPTHFMPLPTPPNTGGE